MGRLLGAESVGYYFVALILMQLCASLSRIGLSDGLLRYLPIYIGENDAGRANGIVVFSISVATVASVLVSLLLLTVAVPISNLLFKQVEFVPYVRWIAATLPLFTLLILFSNSAQALRRMDLVVLSRDFIQPLTMLTGGLVLFFSVRTQTSFLEAYFGSMVIAVLTSIYFLVHAWPYGRAVSHTTFDHWRELLAFSLPLAGGDVVHYLFRWSDIILLSFLRSSAEVGIYNAALRTTLLLNLLAMSVGALYGPMIADHYHQRRYNQIQSLLSTLIRWSLTMACPIVLAILFSTDEILNLWGAEFSGGTVALRILAISQLAVIVSTPLSLTLLMCGRQYIELGNIVFILIVNVLLNLIFIPSYGIIGVASSMLLSQIVILVLRIVEIRRVFSFNLDLSVYLKPAAAMFPVAGAAFIIRPAFTTFSTLIGSNIGMICVVFFMLSALYVLTLYCFGIEKEDRQIWRQFKIVNR
jgi:O-antigen/teichoic acid export membrane protein